MYPRQNVSDQCFSFPLLPDVVVEEFFEYDAEDFLVFLTLLITEGRTPECSVKGRTEGLHCPPAKSALPPLHRHECSDKLPQCVQARRVRSEVCVLWRNSIPIMVEVMLLPDCCYGDESPPSDPISDPAIKQDALLLERWTLQPVPRQSGDRFIEEKTLLLAVRSYVFFSQLSAWLSASHGIVPRNILYRISAADEECVCQFSQPPAEHLFPVPNVSQSVALRLRVQSLPRQPTYPTLACSIHTGLTLNGSDLPRVNKGQTSSAYHLPISPRPSPRPHRKLSSTLPLPPGGKTVRWLYSLTSDPSDDITHTTEDYGKAVNGAESSKGRGSEAPRAFKTYSLAEPPRCPSPRPSSETNPLIGSLLQERQEVIARIAQRLNFCDPTAPHLPPALFTPDTPTKTPVRSSYLGNTTLSKTKGPEGAPPTEDTPPSPFDTPIGDAAAIIRETLSPKPVTQRDREALRDRQRERDSSLLSHAVQDITRLIQDRLSVPSLSPTHSRSSSPLHKPHTHSTHTLCTDTHTTHRGNSHSSGHCNGYTPSHDTHTPSHTPASTDRTPKSLHPNRPQEEPRPSSPKDNILRTIQTLTVTQTTTLTQTTAQTLTTKFTHTQTTALIQNHMKPLTQSHNQTQTVSRTPPSRTQGSPRTQSSSLQDENQPPPGSKSSSPPGPATTPPGTEPCNSRRKHNRHSLDSTLTKAFHPCTGLPLLSSPVPQRRTQTGYFDLDSSLTSCKGLPWTAGKRVCVKRVEESEEPQPLFSASAPPASLSLLGNFEECVLNYRLEPLGSVEGFMAEVGASGTFCPSHMTFPVDVSFYSISDDNAPSPYMGVINLETLGKRGYRVPPSGTIQVTLFNPNKTVVKMFVVVYDLRAMPAGHQTFLRQRTFSVPVRRDSTHSHKHGTLSLGQERILRYLIHLRFQTSRSGKVYLHRDIRLLFSRKSMEVDSGAAYELKSYTESPADPAFSPRC
uniref:Atos homolog protein A n=1 Tax=Oncorhynchus mykiss TaxID=8022 RepID=A0A8C7RYF9_ONCMY